MKKIMFAFTAALLLIGCGSTSQVASHETNTAATTNTETAEKATQNPEPAKKKSLYKGDGFAIAVTAPQLRDSDGDAWIPQFLQDSLTNNFVRFTKMRVIDRANENLVKAELRRTESAYYSDEDSLEIGKLTNAKYVVFGSVQKIGSDFALNVRVNDIETNEIKASANRQSSLADIESGKTPFALTLELFEGLEIELSDDEKRQIAKTTATESRSTESLAKGSSAEKSGDFVSALSFYAQTGGTAQKEASRNTGAILGNSVASMSISERAAYYNAQKEKWNKIFADLKPYLARELPIFVYDSSAMQDELDMKRGTAKLTVTQGIKVVPNRTAVIVWKEIMDAWQKIRADKENDVWASAVKVPYLSNAATQTRYDLQYDYRVQCALRDNDGNVIATTKANPTLTLWYYDARIHTYGHNLQSQKRYFDDAKWQKFAFAGVKISDITDKLSMQIAAVESDSGSSVGAKWNEVQNPVLYSLAEWNEFAKR